MPKRASTSSTRAQSASSFGIVGSTPLAHMKLAPSPASRSPGDASASSQSGKSSSAVTPSRRSPISSMTMTSCTRPCSSAARDSARSTVGSELRLASQSRTTSGASVTEGMRSIMIGQEMPPRRSRRTLSMRDSPRPAAPPRSIARPTSGRPPVALVTPKTATPCAAHRRTISRVFSAIASRSMAMVGAGMAVTQAGRRAGAPGAFGMRRAGRALLSGSRRRTSGTPRSSATRTSASAAPARRSCPCA